MRILLFCQYYRCRDPERQQEIDRCLQANLNHPLIDRAVLMVEPDAPPLPPATCAVETIPLARRLTYRDWLQRLASEEAVIGVLINADIELEEGWERLREVLAQPDQALALSRYNINHTSDDSSLNQYPHWTQDTWAIRSDAAITASLLNASGIPLGAPGCDNRIAHVLWSHGFVLKNPCYQLRSLHHHQQQQRTYDMEVDRLYGAAAYVHPSLTVAEPSELEHAIWSQAQEPLSGLLVNQRGPIVGVQHLLPSHTDGDESFQRLQHYLQLRWNHRCLGSTQAHLYEEGESGVRSEDSFVLPLDRLQTAGVKLNFLQPELVSAACLRLPRCYQGFYALQVVPLVHAALAPERQGSLEITVQGGGVRNLLGDAPFGEQPLGGLQLRLRTAAAMPQLADGGAELVLFCQQVDGEASAQPEHIMAATTAEAAANTATETDPPLDPASSPLPPLEGAIQMQQSSWPTAQRWAPSTVYSWIPRGRLEGKLGHWPLLAEFGERFCVYEQEDDLYFEDRFWPWLGRCSRTAIPTAGQDQLALFLWGFCQPCLSLFPTDGWSQNDGWSPADRCSPSDQDALAEGASARRTTTAWGRTELDAYLLHQQLPGPQHRGTAIQLYIAVPWGDLIAFNRGQDAALDILRGRLQALAEQLQFYGLSLETHSVCGHPHAPSHGALFRLIGLNHLWLTYHTHDAMPVAGLQIHPWHGYPYLSLAWHQPETITIKPPAQKPFLVSCIGSLPEDCPDHWRQELLGLRDHHRILIDLDAAEGEEREGSAREAQASDTDERESHERGIKARENCELKTLQRWQRVWRDSIFSLCPVVAGQPSPWFWQVLALGSIPVLIGELPALPDLAAMPAAGEGQSSLAWQEVVVVLSADQISRIPELLQTFSAEAIARRQQHCLQVMDWRLRQTCFASVAQRPLPTLATTEAQQAERPYITIPYYGADDHYFWRRRKNAFYEVVIEWYLRGLVNIKLGDKGYFWWGEPGGILLFDRDLIIDLYDGKRDPPRWTGPVAYLHGLFANQYHLPHARHHKLTYWASSPRQLEQFRHRIGRRPWQERYHGSAYAGSIENETQEFFRSQFIGWDNYIDVYACADRLNRDEPLPYSIQQYLDLISRSRFGVCFRGNGPKCYREIECLALGTPLIITDGVEVDYPEPLQEGVHFFRAHSRKDIPNIVSSTTAAQWESMSQACWHWFERHGTLDRLFNATKTIVESLDQSTQKHNRVWILADQTHNHDCLAEKSLRIMDPEAVVIWDRKPPAGALVMEPDEIVVNALPLVGDEHEQTWKCSLEMINKLAAPWLASEHPQHRSLCTMLGLRLRNFKVEIHGQGGMIPVQKRVTNAGTNPEIYLADANEMACLAIDFDWSRRCRMKYPHIRHRIAGPAVLRQVMIQASMSYRCAQGNLRTDLSEYFYDYHAVYGRLIPASMIHSICKLYAFAECEIRTITGYLIEAGQRQEFAYVVDRPQRFRLISFDPLRA